MQLTNFTIILPDNLIVVDRVVQNFSMTAFKPPINVKVLNWSNGSGQIENTDDTVNAISQLPKWASDIVDEFKRLRAANQASLTVLKLSEVIRMNGLFRKNRAESENGKQMEMDIKRLKRQVAELLTK